MPRNCARPRLTVFLRDMPRSDISFWLVLDQKETLWWPQNCKHGSPLSWPKRQPSARKEDNDVESVNWWRQPRIQGARTIGSPSREAIWRPSPVLCMASSSRPAASTADLLPLPTGVGFLPGFEHVKEKVWLRFAVSVINELGEQRATAPWNSHFGTTTCTCWCCFGVRFAAKLPCGRDGRGRDYSRSGPRSW